MQSNQKLGVNVDSLNAELDRHLASQPKVSEGELYQKTIAEDGTIVVKIYYNKKEINLSLNLDGGGTTTPLSDGKLKGRRRSYIVLVGRRQAFIHGRRCECFLKVGERAS